jgi:hypothetical protein
VLAKVQQVEASIGRGAVALFEAQETVKLLAPPPVRDAATVWIDAVFYRRPIEGLEAEFLRLARIDVGSDPAERGRSVSLRMSGLVRSITCRSESASDHPHHRKQAPVGVRAAGRRGRLLSPRPAPADPTATRWPTR